MLLKKKQRTITVSNLIKILDKAYHGDGTFKRIHDGHINYQKTGQVYNSGDGLADFVYNEIADVVDPGIRTGKAKTVSVGKYMDSDIASAISKASMELHFIKISIRDFAYKAYGKKNICRYLSKKASEMR